MLIATVEQMRVLEKKASDLGHTYEKMMELAGTGIADFIDARFYSEFEEDSDRTILGLIGNGNNGGDALIALKILQSRGWTTRAYLVKDRAENDPLVSAYQEAGGNVEKQSGDTKYATLKKWCSTTQFILDGILGTGARLPMDDTIHGTLKTVGKYESGTVILAVDCPSGIDCSTGETSPDVLHSDYTLCMAAVKTGLLTFPAFEYCGNLVNISIGFEKSLPGWENGLHEIITPIKVASLLPRRPLDAHKGTFGTAMIVAGSINYTGAVLLSSEAAYRSGAGLVRAAIPGMIHTAIAGQIPEVTWLLLPHEAGVIDESAVDVLRKNLNKVTAMLIGPGLETEETTRHFIRRLFSRQGTKGTSGDIGFVPSTTGETKAPTSLSFPPLVIDADALRILADIQDWWKLLPANSILTPHPGEMAALTGLSIKEIQERRLDLALLFARQWNQIVILKGALTVIATPEGHAYLSTCANPSLARAGSGDLLAGLITGFLAQGVKPVAAAQLGVWIHGYCGDLAAEDVDAAAILPSDLVIQIPASIGLLRELAG
ncbi:MAG: NAD(P)H-hydrate dehydratase [Leptolinea sp.]|jgi:NAD(P)H-hydrate epimerase|nr:NAD(P)H-hydrate dehydratase [Leptolinea sp.]